MGFAPAQGSGGEGPTHLMPEQGSDPVAVLDAGTVYTKDVAGASELFFEDSAGNDVQLTSGGSVVGGASPGGASTDIQTNDGAGGFGAPGPEINAAAQINADAGTALLPGVVGDGDTNTGIAWLTGDEISLCCAGAVVGDWSAAGLSVIDGSAAAPSIAALSDPNTGVAWLAGDELSLCAAGAVSAEVTAQGIGAADGVEATPGIYFKDDPDMGWWRRGANEMALSLGGSLAAHFISGINSRMRIFGRIQIDDNASGNGPGIMFDISGSNPALNILPWNGSQFNDRGLTVSDSQIGVFEDKSAVAGADEITGWRKRVGQVATSDATVTTIFTETLEDDAVYLFEGRVVGRDAAGTERCFYRFTTGAHREGGGGATLTTITWAFASETDAGLDATFDVSGNALRCRITGKAGTDMQWCASIDWIGTKENA